MTHRREGDVDILRQTHHISHREVEKRRLYPTAEIHARVHFLFLSFEISALGSIALSKGPHSSNSPLKHTTWRAQLKVNSLVLIVVFGFRFSPFRFPSCGLAAYCARPSPLMRDTWQIPLLLCSARLRLRRQKGLRAGRRTRASRQGRYASTQIAQCLYRSSALRRRSKERGRSGIPLALLRYGRPEAAMTRAGEPSRFGVF